jgi:1-acyl-sn-glycerol-3-phosphate acyltransferase
LHTAHPLLRQAVRIWSGHVLAGSTLNGVEHLSAATAAGPTAVVCNHRSYIDSNAIDTILYGHAPDRLADRFVSAAGPKVYQGLFRRLVSASLNTIPVPQSATLGHTARLPGRDLARQSLEAVAQSHVAMNNGYVLLIYPEGARTRTGRMQPFLPAVHRYFKQPGTRIVPAALTGTARVIGVGERGVRPKPCALRFGPPILVEKAGGPRGALAKAQAAVCDLLPPELRPEEAPAGAGS